MSNNQESFNIETVYSQMLEELKAIPSQESQYHQARLAYQVGMEYHWAENHEKREKYFSVAQKLLESIIAEDKSFGKAYAELGMIHYRLGDVAKGLTFLDTGENLSSANPWIFAYKGGIIYNQGNHKQASEMFQRAIELDESCAEAWNNLGNYNFYIIKDYKQATVCYLKASEILPYYASALGKLANSLGQTGKIPAAAEASMRSYKLLPSYGNLMLLVEAYLIMGNKPQALKYIHIGQKLFPIQSYFQEKERSLNFTAVEIINKAKEDYNNPIHLYEMGLLLARLESKSENKNKSIELFERSVQLDPSNAFVWKDLGTSYLGMGRQDKGIISFELNTVPFVFGSKQSEFFEKALVAYEKALELEKDQWLDDIGFQINYASALQLNKKLDAAKEVLVKLLSISPNNKLVILLSLIGVLSELKEFTSALGHVNELLEVSEYRSQMNDQILGFVLFQKATFHLQLNQEDEAITALKDAIGHSSSIRDFARKIDSLSKNPRIQELLKPKLNFD